MVSQGCHNCPQTSTGRAVRAGAVRRVLVLFWCYTTHKCDKKAIKVVFLVVSGIFWKVDEIANLRLKFYYFLLGLVIDF